MKFAVDEWYQKPSRRRSTRLTVFPQRLKEVLLWNMIVRIRLSFPEDFFPFSRGHTCNGYNRRSRRGWFSIIYNLWKDINAASHNLDANVQWSIRCMKELAINYLCNIYSKAAPSCGGLDFQRSRTGLGADGMWRLSRSEYQGCQRCSRYILYRQT